MNPRVEDCSNWSVSVDDFSHTWRKKTIRNIWKLPKVWRSEKNKVTSPSWVDGFPPSTLFGSIPASWALRDDEKEVFHYFSVPDCAGRKRENTKCNRKLLAIVVPLATTNLRLKPENLPVRQVVRSPWELETPYFLPRQPCRTKHEREIGRASCRERV